MHVDAKHFILFLPDFADTKRWGATAVDDLGIKNTVYIHCEQNTHEHREHLRLLSHLSNSVLRIEEHLCAFKLS